MTVALVYLGGYFVLRAAMTWMIGVHGLKQTRIMEADAADPGVGRGRVRDLAGEFSAQQHPLARRGLLHSGGATGAGGFTCAEVGQVRSLSQECC